MEKLLEIIDRICIKYGVLNKTCEWSINTLQGALSEAIKPRIKQLEHELEEARKCENVHPFPDKDEKGNYLCSHVKEDVLAGNCVWCHLSTVERGFRHQAEKAERLEKDLTAANKEIAALRLRIRELEKEREDCPHCVEIGVLRDRIAKVCNLLGGPYMDYSPENAVKEYEERIQGAVKMLKGEAQ